jgi:hypothetical protein
MILKGVISADVGGGAKMYKNAFFTEEFAVSNPEKAGMLHLSIHFSFDTNLFIYFKSKNLYKIKKPIISFFFNSFSCCTTVAVGTRETIDVT